MGRSPVPLARETQGLIIRGGGTLNRDMSLGGRIEGGGGLESSLNESYQTRLEEATYLSGRRHFWMTWIVEGEKEARYSDVRQDGRWGWRDKRTSLRGYKSKGPGR